MDASLRLRLLARQQDGVITAAQCRREGVTPAQVQLWCRDKRWRRLSRGVYLVDADLHAEPPRRALVRAGVLSAGPDAVLVLQTAAEVHGIGGVRPDPAVHVSLPGAGARPRRTLEPDLRLHQLALRRDEIMMVNGLVVTTPARTVADLLLRVDRYSAVSLLDSGLHQGLLSADELPLVDAMLHGRRGAVTSRAWLAEADGRAESPLETRIRLRCVDGEVPPETLQHEVYDPAGRLLAVGDLAWPRARLIVEGDGVEAHDNPTAVFRDRARQNDLTNAGYRLLRFTWSDTMTPGHIPDAVRLALTRRRFPPQDRAAPRSW